MRYLVSTVTLVVLLALVLILPAAGQEIHRLL